MNRVSFWMWFRFFRATNPAKIALKLAKAEMSRPIPF
jgi:hypothetical protein